MKKLLILAMTICCAAQLQLAAAQSAEIQQLVLNIEKLAQFKQILSNMKKGYTIVSKGYTTIRDISQGSFNLHDGYLNGLLMVNPVIRKYGRVADIIRNEGIILSEYKSAYSRLRSGGRFTPQELDYIGKVYSSLFSRSLENLDELTIILTETKVRMSDDERIEGIDRIDRDMKDQLAFLRSFNRKTSAVDAQRKREQQDNDNLKSCMAYHNSYSRCGRLLRDIPEGMNHRLRDVPVRTLIVEDNNISINGS